MYDSAQTNNALSRFGLGGSKVAYVNTAASKYRNNNAFSAKKDEFKVFHDIPNSSLLLTNYDPFYSPLLSRLDAVFQQFNLGLPNDEKCREKLVRYIINFFIFYSYKTFSFVCMSLGVSVLFQSCQICSV